MGVLVASVAVIALVALVVAGNRRADEQRRSLRIRWVGNAAAWTITLVAGVVGALLVTWGLVNVIDPNTDTAPVAAGVILTGIGALGAVLVIRARRG